HRLADVAQREGGHELREAPHRLTVHRDDDVADREARRLRRSARSDIFEQQSPAACQAQAFGELRCDLDRPDPDDAAMYGTVRAQLLVDELHDPARDREAEPLAAATRA